LIVGVPNVAISASNSLASAAVALSESMRTASRVVFVVATTHILAQSEMRYWG
jgi:hypothetical protein